MQDRTGSIHAGYRHTFGAALVGALLLLGLLAALPLAAAQETTVLYDGDVGDGTQTPDDQDFTYVTIIPSVAPSAAGGVTTLDTTANNDIYAGFIGNANVMPTLDRTAGYTVSFTARVVQETHSSEDRAGLSIIVLSSDAIGLELAFWENEIWAQHDNQTGSDYFIHAEGVFTDTTQRLTRYDLAVFSDTYTLLMSNTAVLSGSLRDYTGYEGALDPYETANFLFLGDDTTSASAIFELASVEVTTNIADEPEPPENNPPAFTSTPPLSATVGAAYRYEIAASDPDASDVLTITAPLLPEWASLVDAGDGTATLSGTPQAEGVYAVGLLVQDSGGLNATQLFSITVEAADEPPDPPENSAPFFTSIAAGAATVGIAYRYEIAASDPDASDVLTVTAPLLPEWLALEDEATWIGVLNGTPQASDVGEHSVRLVVRDSGGLSDTQAFDIIVRAADDPPDPDPANTLFLPLVRR
jgi:hypothetical protein